MKWYDEINSLNVNNKKWVIVSKKYTFDHGQPDDHAMLRLQRVGCWAVNVG